MAGAVKPSVAPRSFGARGRNIRSRARISRTCFFGRGIVVRCRFSLGLALLLLCVDAGAQMRQPTDQEVEKTKQLYRQPSDAEVEAARQKYRMPTERELSGAAETQSPVNVDAIPRTKGQIDVEALARSYEANRRAFETKGYAIDQPALLVFVTLGMPERTLRLPIDPAPPTTPVLRLR